MISHLCPYRRQSTFSCLIATKVPLSADVLWVPDVSDERRGGVCVGGLVSSGTQRKKQADTHSVITFVGCFLNQAPFSFNHGLSFSCVTFASKAKKKKKSGCVWRSILKKSEEKGFYRRGQVCHSPKWFGKPRPTMCACLFSCCGERDKKSPFTSSCR